MKALFILAAIAIAIPSFSQTAEGKQINYLVKFKSTRDLQSAMKKSVMSGPKANADQKIEVITEQMVLVSGKNAASAPLLKNQNIEYVQPDYELGLIETFKEDKKDQKAQDKKKKKKNKLDISKICNLEINDIDQLLQKQNNNCYFCDKKLNMYRGYSKQNNISLDRLDNNLGHSKNNVVLSCVFCNIGRNCADENQWKEMIKVLKNDGYQPDYSNEIKYTKWGSNLKDRIIMRNKKITETDDSDITLEWIKAQPLKCYYTGITLFPSKKSWYVFQPSLDRIDNTKGYTKRNVIMTCRGLNSARNQMEFFEFMNYLKTFKTQINKLN